MRTFRRSGFCRSAVRVGLLALVLGLSPMRSARADLIFLKDGFVLEGRVRRESVTEVDPFSKEPFVIPKGFFLIDDGARRVYFSPTQVRIVEKKEPPVEERVLRKSNKLLLNPRILPPLLEVVEEAPWDKNWDRVFRFRSPDATVAVPEHMSELSSYYARVDATNKFFWSCVYLTRELGPETVAGLLASHPDFQPKKGETPADVAARRLRYCTFFAQAGWYDHAERELDRLLKDLPDQKERVETARTTLNKMRTRERFEEIKRLHQAGQQESVRKRIADFPSKQATEPMLVHLRELKAEHDTLAEQQQQASRHLEELGRIVIGPHRDILASAAQTIREELHVRTVGRLDAFLGQAQQAERFRLAGRAPDLAADQLLSLAVSGWLLGTSSAEANPVLAARLWRTRQMVLDYLRSTDLAERQTMVGAYLKQPSQEQASLDEIMQMIPQLPPLAPEKNLSPGPLEVHLGSTRRSTSYHIQVPPEYRHGRPYPVLIVLHQGGEKATAMLRRFSDLAAENGYILVAPQWDPGLAGTYGYTADEHAIVLETLRDLRRRYQVDSDRVFLFGAGQGGNMAFDVGLAHPDLFAGVLTMAAGPELFPFSCWRNGQYLPFYVVNGNRAGPGHAQVRKQFENWILRGYPMIWVEYKGRGAEWFGAELPLLFDWMRSKRRAFPLHQLGTDGNGGQFGNEFCTLRPSDNHFYWLSTDDVSARCCNTAAGWSNLVQPATLTARVNTEANEIVVRTSGVKQLTVWLGRNSKGDNMIDWDRPLTVRIGFKAYWNNRRIAPSLATLLEDLYQRGDRQQLFLAKIDVETK
jgi:pimeloyl-ACP methyl ester carboxylesterase